MKKIVVAVLLLLGGCGKKYSMPDAGVDFSGIVDFATKPDSTPTYDHK
jgi:hypothetical protein